LPEAIDISGGRPGADTAYCATKVSSRAIGALVVVGHNRVSIVVVTDDGITCVIPSHGLPGFGPCAGARCGRVGVQPLVMKAKGMPKLVNCVLLDAIKRVDRSENPPFDASVVTVSPRFEAGTIFRQKMYDNEPPLRPDSSSLDRRWDHVEDRVVNPFTKDALDNVSALIRRHLRDVLFIIRVFLCFDTQRRELQTENWNLLKLRHQTYLSR
jgi:hypothetical protein